MHCLIPRTKNKHGRRIIYVCKIKNRGYFIIKLGKTPFLEKRFAFKKSAVISSAFSR